MNSVDSIISFCQKPPKIGKVEESSFIKAIVVVPKGSLSAYQQDEVWGKFWNLQEANNTLSVCDAPIIDYVDGKIRISSSTPNAECFYTITSSDIVQEKKVNGDITLSATYNITAYAVASGYEKSATTTATLCWIDGRLETDGVSSARVEKRPIIISNRDGFLQIKGINAGEILSLYSTDGKLVSSARANTNIVTIDVTMLHGNVALVKIGNECIKVVVR